MIYDVSVVCSEKEQDQAIEALKQQLMKALLRDEYIELKIEKYDPDNQLFKTLGYDQRITLSINVFKLDGLPEVEVKIG